MKELNSEQKQPTQKAKSAGTGSFEKKIILFMVGLFSIGCIGYVCVSKNWLRFFFAHTAALGIMGLLGGLAGVMGKKNGYGFLKPFLLGFGLPVSIGIITTLLVHLSGGRGCGGIVSIITAILIIAGYYFMKKKDRNRLD